jgi:hypothetical protein
MFTHEFFEEASKEFMRGKVRVGHMIYYVCGAKMKSGKPCGRRASQKDIFADRLCTQHLKCQSKPEEQVKVDEQRFGAERQYSRFGRRLIPAKV